MMRGCNFFVQPFFAKGRLRLLIACDLRKGNALFARLKLNVRGEEDQKFHQKCLHAARL